MVWKRRTDSTGAGGESSEQGPTVPQGGRGVQQGPPALQGGRSVQQGPPAPQGVRGGYQGPRPQQVGGGRGWVPPQSQQAGRGGYQGPPQECGPMQGYQGQGQQQPRGPQPQLSRSDGRHVGLCPGGPSTEALPDLHQATQVPVQLTPTAASPSNPYNPYIPSAYMGVDGSYVVPQTYYLLPAYQHPISPFTYYPQSDAQMMQQPVKQQMAHHPVHNIPQQQPSEPQKQVAQHPYLNLNQQNPFGQQVPESQPQQFPSKQEQQQQTQANSSRAQAQQTVTQEQQQMMPSFTSYPPLQSLYMLPQPPSFTSYPPLQSLYMLQQQPSFTSYPPLQSLYMLQQPVKQQMAHHPVHNIPQQQPSEQQKQVAQHQYPNLNLQPQQTPFGQLQPQHTPFGQQVPQSQLQQFPSKQEQQQTQTHSSRAQAQETVTQEQQQTLTISSLAQAQQTVTEEEDQYEEDQYEDDPRSWNEGFFGFDSRMSVNEEIQDFMSLPSFRHLIPEHLIRDGILEPSLCLLISGKFLVHAEFVYHLLPPLNYNQITCDGGFIRNFKAVYSAAAIGEHYFCEAYVHGRTEKITPSCLVHELIGAKYGWILAAKDEVKYDYVHLVMDSRDAVKEIRNIIESIIKAAPGVPPKAAQKPRSHGKQSRKRAQRRNRFKGVAKKPAAQEPVISNELKAEKLEIKKVKMEVLEDIKQQIMKDWFKDGKINVKVDSVFREGNVLADHLTHSIPADCNHYNPIFRYYWENDFYTDAIMFCDYRAFHSYCVRFDAFYRFVRERKQRLKNLNRGG